LNKPYIYYKSERFFASRDEVSLNSGLRAISTHPTQKMEEETAREWHPVDVCIGNKHLAGEVQGAYYQVDSEESLLPVVHTVVEPYNE
jgi:hypothetical protein